MTYDKEAQDRKTLAERTTQVFRDLHDIREAFNFLHIEGERLTQEQAEKLRRDLEQIAVDARDIIPKIDFVYFNEHPGTLLVTAREIVRHQQLQDMVDQQKKKGLKTDDD